MTGHCACGAVRIELKSKPDFINDCNCSLCRKTGGAWGYFSASAVTISGDTLGYVRADKTSPAADVRSCKICGCTTHYEFTSAFKQEYPEVDQMGVNMRLFDPADLQGVEVRFANGADWPGEGPFGYRRDPIVIGPSSSW